MPYYGTYGMQAAKVLEIEQKATQSKCEAFVGGRLKKGVDLRKLPGCKVIVQLVLEHDRHERGRKKTQDLLGEHL